MLDEELFLGRLLNGARDTLAMLRPENQGAQDEQVQRALQQFQPFFLFLGRHLTQLSAFSGKLSTPLFEQSSRKKYHANFETLDFAPLTYKQEHKGKRFSERPYLPLKTYDLPLR